VDPARRRNRAPDHDLTSLPSAQASLRLAGQRPRRSVLSSRIKALAAVAVLAFSLTAALGCGGDDDEDTAATTSTSTAETTTPSGGGGSNLKISADPGGALEFTKAKLSAKAGPVKIEMDNPSSVPHAVGIKGNGVDADGNTVNKGGVSTVSANLKAGTYEFYCPVDGHEAAGMKGTLTVK
jgi:plastocyanin